MNRPSFSLIAVLLMVALLSFMAASGIILLPDPVPLVAALLAASSIIAALLLTSSAFARFKNLLDEAESRPSTTPVATPAATTRPAPAAGNARVAELEAEVERLRGAERDLLSAKQAAESAMMAKGEFLATMSHEIRTPLNGIIPLLDLLLSTKLAADQREYLTTAFQSSKQLLSIVDDILDFSKLEANKLELETTGINIKEIVDGVTRLMARNAEAKGLQYSASIDPNVRLAMRGDPTRLRQVLTNLVSNAIKFTDRGAVAVQVSKRGDTRSHTELLFVVRDTGIGISPEGQRKLFQEFTQADNSTTRTFGGTGLGLSICKRIIDLMGGQIGVKSEEGKGSAFWFTIPLLKALGDAQPARTEIEGARALVVTGDAVMLKRLGGMLAGWKMPFTQNNAPAEVVARIKSAAGGSLAVDFLFLDIGSMRATVHAIVRGLARESGLEQMRILVIAGDEPVPEDVRQQPRCHVLERGFSEVELKTLLKGLLAGTVGGGEAVQVDMLEAPPVSTAPRPAAPVATTTMVHAAEPRAGALGGHVLLVEDNPVNRQVAQRLLTLIGLSHEHAENGRIAVERLESGAPFDMVLMDCQMPIMDGYTATRYIRKLQSEGQLAKLPVVAMTANAMVGDREKCIAAGMDDYMSKPLNRTLLEQMLQKWLPPGATSRVSAAAPVVAAAPRTMASAPAPTHSDSAPINAQIVHDLMDMMGAEFSDLVRVYLEDSPRALSALERAAQSNDLDGLVAPSHSLKSTSANLGALLLADMAKRIEHGARSGTIGEPVLLVAQVNHEFQRVSAHLRQLLGNAAA